MEMRRENEPRGLPADMNPLAEERGRKGFPRQRQEWPGVTKRMKPAPDHGEDSYRGSGKLLGRVALVTGGDSGIGRAVAIAFAREGADVAIAYYDEHEDAQDTVGWIEGAGQRALALAGDLQDPGHARSLVERVLQTFGRLNILVNNAGYHRETPEFEKLGVDQLERTFRTNVFASIWLSQAALAHMGAGDSIINTGSTVGLEGHESLVDYAATKAAVHNLTKSLSRLVAARGIRVNCVAPGPVWTPLIVSTRSEEKIRKFGTETVWKRAAQPAEIAPTYVFLASADSRYYTGEIFGPTGGSTTR